MNKFALGIIVILTATALIATLPGLISDEELSAADSGECGTGLTWSFNNATKELTISGTGVMNNYNSYNNPAPWNGLGVRSVKIGSGVASIGDYAFYDCASMTSVDIPSTVKSIGQSAFFNCTSLTSISIPSGVETVKGYAFYRCSAATSLTLPEGLKTIDYSAFSYCSSLSSVTLPSTLTTLGSGAFDYCDMLAEIKTASGGSFSSEGGVLFNADKTTLILYPLGKTGKTYDVPTGVTSITNYAFRGSSLSSITLPAGVGTIGYSAFEDCKSLTSMTLPEGLEWIESGTFRNCLLLSSVTLPASLISISNNVFEGCTSLKSIDVDANSMNFTSKGGVLFNKAQSLLIQYPASKAGATYEVPAGVTGIGEYAFSRCTLLTSITLPASVTSIGYYAFQYCTSLTSMTIPNGVTVLSDYTFYNCTSLVSVTLPESLTEINYAVFYYCSALISVTIPASVDNISGGAFDGCSSLENITVKEGNNDYCSKDGVLFTKDMETLMKYPAKKAGKEYKVPSEVRTIGSNAFYGCLSLTSVTLPEVMTSLNSYVFYGCSSLTSVNIPSGITTIPGYAFYSTSLMSVTIPEGVESIEYGAFGYCSRLTHISIPSTVTSIASSAFDSCRSLRSIDVDKDNEVYASVDGVLVNKGDSALITYPAGKSGEFEIPNGTKWIDQSLFSGYAHITSLKIPASVTVIYEYSFYQLSMLTDITVDKDNPNYISVDGALFTKDMKTLVQYPAGKTGSSYTVPSTVTTLEMASLGGNPYLVSVALPSGLVAINEAAFYFSTSLVSVTIPSNAMLMGYQTFYGCVSLTSINVDKDNSSYASVDGVLFNKDKTVLLEFPAGKTGTFEIPEGVKSIRHYSVFYFSSLTQLKIPSTMTTLDLEFFVSSNLKRIDVHEDNPLFCSEDGVLFNKDKTVLLLCPAGKVGKLEISSTVMKISDMALSIHRSLTAINVSPDNPSYSSVDGVLFDKNKTMMICCPAGRTGDLNIPATMTSLHGSFTPFGMDVARLTVEAGNPAFTAVDGVLFSIDGKTLILYPANRAGTTYKVPSGVTAIWEGAFSESKNLTEITVEAGNSTFMSKGGVLFSADEKTLIAYPAGKKGSYVIPEGTLVIGQAAFMGSAISAVTMPSTLCFVNEIAFLGCNSLTSITILSDTLSFSEMAFILGFEGERVRCTVFTSMVGLLSTPDNSLGAIFTYVTSSQVLFVLDGAPSGVTAPGPITANSGSEITIPDAVQVQGYDVVVLLNGVETSAKSFILSDKGAVVTYKYTIKTFEVIFNGYATPVKEQKAYGTVITKPSTEPVKAPEKGVEFQFIGWKGYTEGMTVTGKVTFDPIFKGIVRLNADGVEDKIDGDKVHIEAEGSEEVALSKETIDAISKKVSGSSEVNSFEVSTDNGAIRFDAVATEHLRTQNAEVTVSMAKIDKAALSESVKGIVKDRPLYEITVNNISDFKGGKLTIGMKYDLQAGENPDSLEVWCVKSDGSLERFDCTYSNGMVYFETTHLSMYCVAYAGSNDVPAIMLPYIIGAVIAVSFLILLGRFGSRQP